MDNVVHYNAVKHNNQTTQNDTVQQSTTLHNFHQKISRQHPCTRLNKALHYFLTRFSKVLEIYGKEYDVHWGEVTNTFTKVTSLLGAGEYEARDFYSQGFLFEKDNSWAQVTRTVARAWIEGKAWAGKGENRDEARNMLIKYLKV